MGIYIYIYIKYEPLDGAEDIYSFPWTLFKVHEERQVNNSVHLATVCGKTTSKNHKRKQETKNKIKKVNLNLI